jgi:hypothetical protein
MSRTTRVLGAVAAACLAVPALSAAPAWAGTSTSGSEAANAYGYFSAEGIAKPDPAPQAPPNVISDHADGVKAGHLAVAAKGGQEDKVSFLYFGLDSVPVDAVFDKVELTVPLVPDSKPDDVVIAADPVKVRACAAGDEGFGGDDGTALSLAPARKCDVFAAPAKATADGKAYTFDLTKLAGLWLTENNGVALAPADGAATTNFQVVFAEASKAMLKYSYTAATETVPVTAPAPPTIGTTTPDLGTGFDSGSAPIGDVGTVSAPLLPAPAPAPAAAAPAAPAVAPTTQVAAGPVALSTPLRPTSGFWLAGLLLAAVLGLLSLIMGDSNVPLAASSTSRLSRALREQRRTGTAPLLTTRRPIAI